MTVNTADEYDNYVRTVAENRLERDPGRFSSVAEVCVASIAVLDARAERYTVTTTPSPYHYECIDPSDVYYYSEQSIPTDAIAGWRDGAVSMLAQDIEDATDEITDS